MAYKWCLHCERTYNKGAYRLGRGANKGLLLCPYPDCDGSVLADGFPWEQIRLVDSTYPLHPDPGVMYPQFGRCRRPRKGISCGECVFSAECFGKAGGAASVASAGVA